MDISVTSLPPSLQPATSAIRAKLYTSHFLSTWNSRVFEFGAVLYLAAIFPDTLMPMSAYALIRGLAAIAFSSTIGNYIDANGRLPVVRLSIVVQRTAVSSSCVLFWLLSHYNHVHKLVRLVTMVLLAALACFEKIFAIMNLICIEKDWVVVIADNDEEALRVMNSQMRRIDLICKLGGPLVIALLSGWSTEAAILLNLAFNCVPVAYEYIAIAQVYCAVPRLQAPAEIPVEIDVDGEQTRISDVATGYRRCATSWLNDITAYCRHTVFLPSFAGALLYLTVLTFGGQMVTYLLASGYTSVQIGLARTISVLVELSATWAAPLVMSRIGTIRAGIWFLNWQLIWLMSASIVFFTAPNPLLPATGLVIGTILSRIGLWGYDLSAQVLIQNEVEAARRGSFASQEAQWQNVFEILSFSITIIFSKPSQFRWPVAMSCGATALAGTLYALFVRTRRGHLFHVSTCVSNKSVLEEEVDGLLMESQHADRNFA